MVLTVRVPYLVRVLSNIRLGLKLLTGIKTGFFVKAPMTKKKMKFYYMTTAWSILIKLLRA